MANLIVDAYAMALPRYACGSLLDLGCGLAPLKGIYKPLVVRSVGVDRNCTVNHAGVDIVHDLREPLPFVDGGFDTLVLSDVLEHIANPDLLWREMARVIRPGGHLLLNVPFFYWLHERPYDYHRYSEFRLRMFAAEHDFEVVNLYPLGGSAEIFADFCAKHLQFVPIVGTALAIALQYCAYRWARSGLGRRMVNLTAVVYPLGYFAVYRRL
jgi:SAM-dependent methyltransferase